MLSFDLHTHSSCSDGELSPEELAREAAERKVSVLALTDHDTSSGTERASAAARKLGVCLVPGIEFSTKWHHNGESFEIHIVGLEIDPRSRMLKAAEQAQRERRTSRILGMAEKLEALGFTGITDYFSGMIDQGGLRGSTSVSTLSPTARETTPPASINIWCAALLRTASHPG